MHNLAFSGWFLRYSLTPSQTPIQILKISTDIVQTDGNGAIIHQQTARQAAFSVLHIKDCMRHCDVAGIWFARPQAVHSNSLGRVLQECIILLLSRGATSKHPRNSPNKAGRQPRLSSADTYTGTTDLAGQLYLISFQSSAGSVLS